MRESINELDSNVHEMNQPAVDDGTASLTLEQAKARLAGKSGKAYWRTLGELADAPEVQKWMEDEFPNRSTIMNINRRDLLKFMGASVALAGLSGCRGVFLPQDKLVPYVKAPEELVPGKPLFYATSVTLAGFATGVLVEQREGRPIKLEGNPDHPASLGSIDAISQAEILNLYDPDRSSSVVDSNGLLSTWDAFFEEARNVLKARKGDGVRLLTGTITSPVEGRAIEKFLSVYPGAQWHVYEPIGRGNVRDGSIAAFGQLANVIYDFSQAKTIVSFDADFLSPTGMPGSLKYARDFASKRRVSGYQGEMNRLYAYESTPGLVGAMADHRWVKRASEIFDAVAGLAAALGIPGYSGGGKESEAIAKDLQQSAGSSIVIAGDHQPADVHALVHLINEKLGNLGKTVKLIEPVEIVAANNKAAGDLKELVADLNKGAVDTVIVVGGNPVYDAPADFKFAAAYAKAKNRFHFGRYEDETAAASTWHAPQTHTLEEWGDARAFDGTVGLFQPLIAPLHEAKSSSEYLWALAGEPKNSLKLVREYYDSRGLDERAWRLLLQDGRLENSAARPLTLATKIAAPLAGPRKSSGVEVMFRCDPKIYDGRYANNGWLQELPNPISKLTWDNVAQIAPAFAKSLGVQDDDLVEISYRGGKVTAGVFIQPGQPDQSVTLHLGYGRTRGGVVCTVTGDEGGGFNAYALRHSDAPYFDGGAEIKKIGGDMNLATTQGHQPLDGNHVSQFAKSDIVPEDDREVIVEYTLAQWLADGKKLVEEKAKKHEEIAENNLYPDKIFPETTPDGKPAGAQWGMTIDMNTCVGCNACVTACQAENNIPVVGKVQVGRHREMHWIRIDRYYSGDEANPTVAWQPVMCVHCEKAPCEPVCPVAATIHSHEGLNQMVYNRCVGTRYCSNNCPYKVRRFNYLNYTDNQRQFDVRIDDSKTNTRIPLLKLLNNPDVTVRGRGIMEKCTYCVQRINDARIEAKKQNRPITDGEVITACQQACPTQAIVFGNIADKDSAVSKSRKDPRGYLLLEELQTRPRTTHLAKLRNPNPELVAAPTAKENTR